MQKPKTFISVWYECCNTYGRLTKNKEETRFEGRCPKCARRTSASIGQQGTNQRVFRAK